MMWDHIYTQFRVTPCGHIQALNLEWFNMYAASDYFYVDEALRKMDLFDLVCLKEDYFPDFIRRLFCTVYFHDDADHTILG